MTSITRRADQCQDRVGGGGGRAGERQVRGGAQPRHPRHLLEGELDQAGQGQGAAAGLRDRQLITRMLHVSFKVDVIGGVPWETVTLTALGRKRELLLRMVEEARKEGTVTE